MGLTGFLISIFLISAVAGAVGSLVGMGGGVLIVPALTILFGVDIRLAIGASIVAIIATSSGAAVAYLRDGLTNLRIGMFLEIATTLGAVTGAHVALGIDPRYLFLIFGVILLVTVLPTLRRDDAAAPATAPAAPAGPWSQRLRLRGEFVDPLLGATVTYQARRPALGFAIMYLAGVVSALLGIGSGPFKVLALDSVMGLPIKVSTTTSNFMIGVTAVASAWIYFLRGQVHPAIAAPVALGVLGGAGIGSRLLPRTGNRVVRLLFAGMLSFVAIGMILKGLR